MEEWKLTKIGSICKKVCSGGTPKSTIEEYYGGEIPWLNTKEVNFNRIYSTETTITEDGLKNSSAKWIDKNAVIVAMYGATAAKCAIGMIPMTTNQACCNLMIDETKADYRFVYYSIVNSFSALAGLANGGAQQNLNAQLIKDFEIALPSLETQKRIADVLSTIDDKIENNNRINHNLEEQAQALYKSWFVDFEPFKGGKFVDSELGIIPEGWRVGTIYDICDVYYGAPFNSTLFNSERKGLPLIRIRDLAKQEAGVFTEERHSKGQLTCKGDILVGMDGEFSIYIWGGEDSWINQRISRFSPKPGISHFFLIETLRPQLKAVESSEVATTVIHIGKNDYDKFLAIIPPQSVLDSFYRVSEPLYLQYVKKLSGNQVLSESRDVLLPCLMSGQLTC